jgi:hypothetical protein
MPAISELTATDNMDSAKKPLLTDLREHTASIVDYLNDSIRANLLQLALDSFPAAYAFDSDGVAQYTNSLYDKITAKDTYTGGDFTISTTGAWTDVDATNASVAITPELAGDFKALFQFSISAVTTNATNEVDVRFRLTDGTDVSDALPRIKQITGATSMTSVIPVTLAYQFDDWSAAEKTVKLQYFITTLTAVTLKVLANTNDPIAMQVEKI